MRSFVICVVALTLVAAPLAAPAQTASPIAAACAPADEYFGRLNESVLEIRNRIALFDGKTDAEIKSPEAIGSMDNVQDAVLAWQHKYPADPWVIDAMARLFEDYTRAGATSDPHANSVLQAMVASYPKSARTGEVLLAYADATTAEAAAEPAKPTGAEVTGSVVDATTGAPVSGAIVILAPNHESSDVTSAPFATTASDGSFALSDIAAGAQYVVIEPPRGTEYAAYHGVVQVSGNAAQVGVIKLAAR